MLIKIFKSNNSIQIIEDVVRPVVHGGTYVLAPNDNPYRLQHTPQGEKPWGPDIGDLYTTQPVEVQLYTEKPQKDTIEVKVIDCYIGNVLHRIIFDTQAHICTDQNIPVEKMKVPEKK